MDVAVPMGGEARARFPDLSVVSFDRGPHSPPDRLGPAGMPEPRKEGFRRRRGAGGAGRERPPPRPDAAGEGAPRAPRRRLTGAPTDEPAHGRPRRRGARTGVSAGRRRPECSPYVPASDRPVEAPRGPARVP